MCIFHYTRYHCGFEEIRSDVNHRLCPSFVEIHERDPNVPCCKAEQKFQCSPWRCGRCRVCGLEKARSAENTGPSRHMVVVCSRHAVTVGSRSWVGDTSKPRDPKNCDACWKEAQDDMQDNLRRRTAAVVYGQAGKGNCKSWAESCRKIGQDIEQLSEARAALRDPEFKIQFPGMTDERHRKVVKLPMKTDLILNTASTEQLLRQVQERRRRYDEMGVNGKIRAILQRYGVFDRSVDAQVRSVLEMEEVPDHEIEVMTRSLLRHIGVSQGQESKSRQAGAAGSR